MNRKNNLTALLLAGSLALTGCAKTQTESTPDSTAVQTTASPAPEPAPVTVQDVPADFTPPVFSAEGGFCDAPFSLTLSAADDAAIFYTLDGSTPTVNSTRYTAPIEIADRSAEPNTISAETGIAPTGMFSPPVTPPDKPVDKAAVVRAFAVSADGIPSPVVSQTYFVGFKDKAKFYQDVKIVSLQTDADNLFDYETGIYVLGKCHDDWKNGDAYDASVPDYFMPANYTQKGRDWERPAAIQIFADGKPVAAENAGIRIHGGATRSYAQKSLNVYFRKQYGASKLQCDLFSGNVTGTDDPGRPVTVFDSFMLRNAGNDAYYTRFRDKLNQSLVSGFSFLTQGMEPCIVFLNGEFWGHYEITEKIDASYISSHTGIPKKDIVIVKNEEPDAGAEEAFDSWQQLREYIRGTDFSDQDAYERLCAAIDMQGFAEYVSSEIYVNNINWDSSNMGMWRSEAYDPENPLSDGKWRFLMFDTEYSTNIYGEAKPSDNTFAKLMKKDNFIGDLLKAALKNEGFRQQFRETFTQIAEQNFSSERVNAEINKLEAEYHDMTVATYNRFWCDSLGGTQAERNYQQEVQQVRQFFEKRGEQIMKHLDQLLEDAAEG